MMTRLAPHGDCRVRFGPLGLHKPVRSCSARPWWGHMGSGVGGGYWRSSWRRTESRPRSGDRRGNRNIWRSRYYTSTATRHLFRLPAHGYPGYGYPGYRPPGYGYPGFSGYPAYSGPPGYGYPGDLGHPAYPGSPAFGYQQSQPYSPYSGSGTEIRCMAIPVITFRRTGLLGDRLRDQAFRLRFAIKFTLNPQQR